VLVAVICCYSTARLYFLFPISGNPAAAAAAHARCHANAIQLHMPLGPAANANATGMCSWGWTKSNAHGPRLKAGVLVGLRDTIRYKRLEVCLEALGEFATCVLINLS
jgi:hypothetical protein